MKVRPSIAVWFLLALLLWVLAGCVDFEEERKNTIDQQRKVCMHHELVPVPVFGIGAQRATVVAYECQVMPR